MTDGWTETTAGTDSSEQETGFEPTIDADDEFFVVVKTDLIESCLGVFEPIETNALLSGEAGSGIKLHSSTENCYWFETQIADDTLDRFEPDGQLRKVDIDSLKTAVAGTVADRIALHGKADGSLFFRDGTEKVQVTAEETPLSDEYHAGRIDNSKMFNITRFSIESSRFEALIGADSTHDHIRMATDSNTDTVQFGFFDTEERTEDRRLEIQSEKLVEPPSMEYEETETVETLICRESIDDAMPPMRGPVTVAFGDSDGMGSNFEYRRADGDVLVNVLVSGKEEASL